MRAEAFRSVMNATTLIPAPQRAQRRISISKTRLSSAAQSSLEARRMGSGFFEQCVNRDCFAIADREIGRSALQAARWHNPRTELAARRGGVLGRQLLLLSRKAIVAEHCWRR
jgi:hypothetical protein